jgi:hypothetical protein
MDQKTAVKVWGTDKSILKEVLHPLPYTSLSFHKTWTILPQMIGKDIYCHSIKNYPLKGKICLYKNSIVLIFSVN